MDGSAWRGGSNITKPKKTNTHGFQIPSVRKNDVLLSDGTLYPIQRDCISSLLQE
jgi:hypothetical protein